MNISQRLRTCARHTGLDAVIELLQEAADEIDALQARAQVQSEVFGYIHHFDTHDERGVLIDTTWEADGGADPLPHPTFPSMWKWTHCTPFYTTPQPAQAAQAEVTDEELLDAYNSIDPCNESPQDRLIRRLRATLALRPERVPMTDAAREHFLAGYESAQQDALVCRLPPSGWACTRKAGHEGPCAAVPTDDAAFVKRGMDRLREAHHGITAQAKKETP